MKCLPLVLTFSLDTQQLYTPCASPFPPGTWPSNLIQNVITLAWLWGTTYAIISLRILAEQWSLIDLHAVVKWLIRLKAINIRAREPSEL